jgi:hypothetical protein
MIQHPLLKFNRLVEIIILRLESQNVPNINVINPEVLLQNETSAIKAIPVTGRGGL